MRRSTISLLVLIGFLFCFNASALAGPSASTATFVGTDTTTLGGWTGTYGTVGYYIPNGPSMTPSDGSTFNAGAASLFTWGTNVASGSALKTGAGMDIASCWYKNLGNASPSLTLDVDVTSGSQTVALYLLDYDKQGRSESVSVTDISGNQLDGPHGVSGTNFANGEYLLWTITGEVHITITLVNGPNAVANGIFFGQSITMPPPVATGAYFNHSKNTISTSTQVNKLTLPAGTYLINFTVNVASPTVLSTAVPSINCILTPTNLTYGLSGTSPPSITGYANVNLSAADRLTLTIPGTVTATCNPTPGGSFLVESVLEAIPVPSITIEADDDGC